jgi:hypothetical protein
MLTSGRQRAADREDGDANQLENVLKHSLS